MSWASSLIGSDNLSPRYRLGRRWHGVGECHALILLDTPSYGKDLSMCTNESLKAICKRRERSSDLWRLL